MQIGPLEIGFKGEFVFESVGFVRIGSELSGLVIEDKEEAGVDVIFVKVDAFELIPEVALIADKVPAEFFLIKTEIVEMLIVASFEGLEVFFGLHFLFFGEGENVGDFGLIIVKGSKQLSTGVLVLKLVGVSEDLNVNDGADVDFLKFEIESHVWS